MSGNYGPGVVDSGQISDMVNRGVQAAMQQFNAALPALFNGLTANPYTVRGFEAVTQMAPSVAASLFSPQSLPGMFFTQPLMGRAAFMQGAQQYMAFPGGGGPGGLGFRPQEMQEMFQFARQEMPRATTMELAQVVSGGGQMGAFSTVRNIDQFRRQFRELIDAVRQVTEALGTSLQESMELMNQVRGGGYLTPGAQAGALQQINRASYFSGIAPQALAGAAGAMTPGLRQWGGFTQQQGFQTGLRFMTMMGGAYQSGMLGPEEIVSATGLTPEQGGIQAMAQSYLPAAAERMGRRGRFGYFTAALIDPTTGRADRDMMDRLASGQMTQADIQREATSRVRQIGGANWVLNRRKFAGAIMEADPLAEAQIYRNILQERGVEDMQDPRARLLLGRLTGASQEQLDVLTPMIENLPVLRIQEQMRAVQQKRGEELGRRMRLRQPEFLQRIGEGIQGAQQKIEEQIISVAEQLEDYALSEFEKTAGIITDTWQSPEIAHLAFGGTTQTERAQRSQISRSAQVASQFTRQITGGRPGGARGPLTRETMGMGLQQLAVPAYQGLMGVGGYVMRGVEDTEEGLQQARQRWETLRTEDPGRYFRMRAQAEEARTGITEIMARQWQAGVTTGVPTYEQMGRVAGLMRGISPERERGESRTWFGRGTRWARSFEGGPEERGTMGFEALMGVLTGEGEGNVPLMSQITDESMREHFGLAGKRESAITEYGMAGFLRDPSREATQRWYRAEETAGEGIEAHILGVSVKGVQFEAGKLYNQEQYSRQVLRTAMEDKDTWELIRKRASAMGAEDLMGFMSAAAMGSEEIQDLGKALTSGAVGAQERAAAALSASVASAAGTTAGRFRAYASSQAQYFRDNRSKMESLIMYTSDSAKMAELDTYEAISGKGAMGGRLEEWADVVRTAMPGASADDIERMLDDPHTMKLVREGQLGTAIQYQSGAAAYAFGRDEASLNKIVQDMFGLTGDQVKNLQEIGSLSGMGGIFQKLQSGQRADLMGGMEQLTRRVLGAENQEELLRQLEEGGAGVHAAYLRASAPVFERATRAVGPEGTRARGLRETGVKGILGQMGVETTGMGRKELIQAGARAFGIEEQEVEKLVRGRAISEEDAKKMAVAFQEALAAQAAGQEQQERERRAQDQKQMAMAVQEGTQGVVEELAAIRTAVGGRPPAAGKGPGGETAEPGGEGGEAIGGLAGAIEGLTKAVEALK